MQNDGRNQCGNEKAFGRTVLDVTNWMEHSVGGFLSCFGMLAAIFALV